MTNTALTSAAANCPGCRGVGWLYVGARWGLYCICNSWQDDWI